MGQVDQDELQKAIAELKASTKVTMETVGVRCNRRVTTSLYKEGLKRLRGPVVVQPPSEDRVSVFVGLVGGKQACLKIFSTGKVRCLKSDFNTQEDAETCAQAIIDRMASIEDSGMPHIRLCDAKFHANGKDLTWSTRQTTDIRKLSKAFQDAGFRAESDTSFGDSVMVVITPPGSDRSVKGQVLADGTIRLAGCRDDGEGAARCVAESLNETGCLLGGKVNLEQLRCEVWLTKRHFQLCGPEWVVDMAKLHRLLLAEKNGRACTHPTLAGWIAAKEEEEYVRSIKVVGTACPRAEVKFMPVVVDEWEQVKRKPEPVSISIHHRGEVQLAGNAEYKVLEAFWFIRDLVHRHAAEVLVHPPQPSGARRSDAAAASARPTKRKLDARLREDAAPDALPDMEPRSLSFSSSNTPAKPAQARAPPLPSPASSAGSLSPSLSAPPSVRAGFELPPLQLSAPPPSSSTSPGGGAPLHAEGARHLGAGEEEQAPVLFGNSPSLDHPLFYGQPLPSNAAAIASPPGSSAYHSQQMMCLAVLRTLCQRALNRADLPALPDHREAEEPSHEAEMPDAAHEEPPQSPTGEKTAASGRETPISPKRRRTTAALPKPSPSRMTTSKGIKPVSEHGALELSSIVFPPMVA